jgi:hypothetical protein
MPDPNGWPDVYPDGALNPYGGPPYTAWQSARDCLAAEDVDPDAPMSPEEEAAEMAFIRAVVAEMRQQDRLVQVGRVNPARCRAASRGHSRNTARRRRAPWS